jgi:hypothetical protein
MEARTPILIGVFGEALTVGALVAAADGDGELDALLPLPLLLQAEANNSDIVRSARLPPRANLFLVMEQNPPQIGIRSS